MTKRKLFYASLFVVATIDVLTNEAFAQSVAEFYNRNPISLYVGSGAGGGFDAYARVFAAHYAKHIPGNPNVIVKNMPGADGLVAMNYIANSASRDGSAILASFNQVILESLYHDQTRSSTVGRLIGSAVSANRRALA